MSLERTKRSTNVYILGAGFSKAAGMPLLPEFMSRMRDTLELVEGLPEESYKALESVLMQRAMLSQVREKVNIDLDNVEQLFGLIDAVHPHGSSFLTDDEKAIRKGISATLLSSMKEKAVVRCQMFNSAAVALEKFGCVYQLPNEEAQQPRGTSHVDVDPYRLFCLLASHKLDPEATPNSYKEDVLVTFNYDLVIEKALKAMGFEPDYQLQPIYQPTTIWLGPDGPVPLLKLHGSINWSLDDSTKAVSVADPTELITDSSRFPVIVPPTWNKGAAFDILDNVWSRAIGALSRATRIFIIGYSMPKSDTFFEHFLAAGLLSNDRLRSLIVVDPKADQIKERLGLLLDKTYFEKRLSFFSGVGQRAGFEDFMGWFEQTAKLMDRGSILTQP
jgi:hypothetical protein